MSLCQSVTHGCTSGALQGQLGTLDNAIGISQLPMVLAGGKQTVVPGSLMAATRGYIAAQLVLAMLSSL